MSVLAHFGKIPVEEWLPFVVPVLALYLYIRRKDRRRLEAVRRLPGASEPLDESTVREVVAQWSAAKYDGISIEHLPLLYPPGPDGVTAAELAGRIGCDPGTVKRLLEDLDAHGYLELERQEDSKEPRGWLTNEGMDLVNVTEKVLLAAIPPGAHGNV